jgi:hypothetical protein
MENTFSSTTDVRREEYLVSVMAHVLSRMPKNRQNPLQKQSGKQKTLPGSNIPDRVVGESEVSQMS